MKTTTKERLTAGRLPLALGCALLFLPSCDETKKPTAKPAVPPAVVTAAEVTDAAVPIVMNFSGTVQAVKIVKIIPRVTGYMEKRYFKEGTIVKEGDQLYLIDPRPFQDKLLELAAQLKGYEANRTFAEAEVKRYKKAGKKGAVSQEQVDEAIAKIEEAQAEVEATEASVEKAKLDLSYTILTAPFEGRIQTTLINVGNLVTAEQDVLTSLVQLDPIYVVFNLSRRQVFDIQRLRTQGLVTLELKKLKVEVLQSDGSIYPHQGHVDFVGSEIDPTTDTLVVRGVLPNPLDQNQRGTLVPGQYAPVRLILGTRPGALVIPQEALVETQVGKHVFVVGKDNFFGNAPGTSPTATNGPVRTAIEGGQLFLLDNGNHRVMIWNSLPTSNVSADVVVGQTNFFFNQPGTSAASLRFPFGLAVADGILFVADSGNNRVMIWNRIPTVSGAPADLVLGQTNFTSGGAGLSDSRLNSPDAVWSDGTRVVVADTNNNRVLVWNAISVTSGVAADIVVGQPDFDTGMANTSQTGLRNPRGVYSNGLQLFVVDSANKRVLVYNPFPTSNQPLASIVLGQPDFNQNDAGTSVAEFRSPTGSSVVGNQLLVADNQNSRVMVFDGQQ